MTAAIGIIAALVAAVQATVSQQPADLVLSTADGARWASIQLADDGVLHIEAASGACVDRSNWCGRYRRNDCAPSKGAVASRLLWRADDGATAAAQLHDDGKLSFEMPSGTCFNPVAPGAGTKRLGLTLRSRADSARINFDPAAGLNVHAPGEVFVGGADS